MKNYVVNFKKSFIELLDNESLSMIVLVTNFLYITIYGFLQNPLLSTGTASEIGLNYPVAFRIWGFFSCAMFLLNIRYMFKKGNYSSKVAYTLMILGSVSVLGTIFIPSTTIFGVQLIAHWGTALMFALLNPIAMMMYFYYRGKSSKKHLYTGHFLVAIMVVCVAILLGLIVAYGTKGKNGLIETIPMWTMQIILFFENFTNIYSDKDSSIKKSAMVK